MIVRLMGEGQYRVDDELVQRLNELDDRAQAATDAEDEPTLDRILDEMAALVREQGEAMPDDDLSASDILVPPSDLTLEETKRLISHEGFIPDIA
jgi:PspAA-like protein